MSGVEWVSPLGPVNNKDNILLFPPLYLCLYTVVLGVCVCVFSRLHLPCQYITRPDKTTTCLRPFINLTQNTNNMAKLGKVLHPVGCGTILFQQPWLSHNRSPHPTPSSPSAQISGSTHVFSRWYAEGLSCARGGIPPPPPRDAGMALWTGPLSWKASAVSGCLCWALSSKDMSTIHSTVIWFSLSLSQIWQAPSLGQNEQR